jgi:hypothetical protein
MGRVAEPESSSAAAATEPIDDTSTAKLMEGVLAAFAQFDNKSSRIERALVLRMLFEDRRCRCRTSVRC